MGFLKKLFGNVEKANKGEIPVEEIVPPFTFDLAEEADDYWRQMEQNLLINAVKAVGGPEAVERAFVLANFKENQETFEELVSGWRSILEQEIPNRPLDSDRPFPYYEV